MNFDALVGKHIGQYGWYQKWTCLATSFVGLLAGFVLFELEYVFSVPRHWCKVPELERLSNVSFVEKLRYSSPPYPWKGEPWYDGCWLYSRNYSTVSMVTIRNYQPNDTANADLPRVPCGSWEYDQIDFTSTFVIQWDLVCDREWLITLLFILNIFGWMLGALTGGIIADRWGRRPVSLACIVLYLSIRIGASFSPSLPVFFLLRSLSVATAAVAFFIIYITVLELLGPSWRGHYGLIMCYSIWLGRVILVLVAHSIPDANTLLLVITFPTAPFLMYICLISESPRWQLAKGRVDSAIINVKRIAQANDKPGLSEIRRRTEDTDSGKVLVLAAFRHKVYRRNLLIILLAWFTASIVFWTSIHNFPKLINTSLYNQLLREVPDVLALLGSHVILYSLVPRRFTLLFGLIISGVMIGVSPAITENNQTGSACINYLARFPSIVCLSHLFVITPEILPTGMRASGVGIAVLAGSLGNALVILLTSMRLTDSVTYPIVVCVGSIIAGLLCIFVPDTKGEYLPDTLSQAIALTRKRSKPTGWKASKEYRESLPLREASADI